MTVWSNEASTTQKVVLQLPIHLVYDIVCLCVCMWMDDQRCLNWQTINSILTIHYSLEWIHFTFRYQCWRLLDVLPNTVSDSPFEWPQKKTKKINNKSSQKWYFTALFPRRTMPIEIQTNAKPGSSCPFAKTID